MRSQKLARRLVAAVLAVLALVATSYFAVLAGNGRAQVILDEIGYLKP